MQYDSIESNQCNESVRFSCSCYRCGCKQLTYDNSWGFRLLQQHWVVWGSLNITVVLVLLYCRKHLQNRSRASKFQVSECSCFPKSVLFFGSAISVWTLVRNTTMVDVPIALVLHFQIFTIKEGTLIIYLSLIEMKGILLDSKISGIEFDPCDQTPHATSSSTYWLSIPKRASVQHLVHCPNFGWTTLSVTM